MAEQELTASTLSGSVSYTELTTDFGRACQNEALMAQVRIPWYNDDGERVSGSLIKGFMTSGFGWSIQNNYEDLLSATGAQGNLSAFLNGAMALSNGLFGQNMGNVSAMSVQQTIAIWTKMNKPAFQIGLLFFDGTGSTTSSVTKAAWAIERALYPWVNMIGDTDINLLMKAPSGYAPLSRNNNDSSNPNKTFSLSAEGLSYLKIGNFEQFPEIIVRGADFAYSNIMLNNGNPQWLNVTLSCLMWRQPLLTDIAERYNS